MKKLNEYKYILLIILIILGFSFYWYSYKPEQIRKKCYVDAYNSHYSVIQQVATDKSVEELMDHSYKDCLLSSGLN